MPVKDNLYDALDYAGQVEEAARSHRKAMKVEKKNDGSGQIQKKPNSGEFLGGFWKEDKLIPSMTLTIYFGSEEWDGPLSLFEMLDVINAVTNVGVKFKEMQRLICVNNLKLVGRFRISGKKKETLVN